MINVCLLGATGSIGTQVLDIIREQKQYNLVAFSFGSNLEKAVAIIEEFHPEMVCARYFEDRDALSHQFPNLTLTEGNYGLQEVARWGSGETIVINALVGSVGLMPTLGAIASKRNVLLANKESLVIGGELVMSEANKQGVKIIPIDSEHSAIYQLLQGQQTNEIKNLILTASGGSLRDKTRDELDEVTLAEVLKHPNWQMGPKITVDSATMMNKGFEVIEAYYLFKMPLQKIMVVIHPESTIHSMVEFNDHSIFAQMATSDMRLPIAYAINAPKHLEYDIIKPLDFSKPFALNFKPLDNNRYPLVQFAKDILIKGGIYPTIMNAANEAAVGLFLEGKLAFNQIENIIMTSTTNEMFIKAYQEPLTADKIILIDELVKKTIINQYS